jgi:two-component system C4-dicarboxylate transport response regulator DctD
VLPPLRERGEDIPLLFLHFASEAAHRHGRELRPLDKDNIAALLRHDWPGNVRELRTAAERFAIGLETPAERLTLPALEATEAWLPAQVAAFERELIAAAIRQHHGDMAAVAQALGIPRRTLNEKMTRHGISRRDATEQASG